MKTTLAKRASAKAYRARNVEQVAQQKKEYRASNADRLNRWHAEYYERNKERLRGAKSEYKRRLRSQAGFNRAAQAARRARLRVPAWADPLKITAVYTHAVKLGLQVDHIVPLTSDLVCGLHVWDNLQLLAADENVRKGNRQWPDCP